MLYGFDETDVRRLRRLLAAFEDGRISQSTPYVPPARADARDTRYVKTVSSIAANAVGAVHLVSVDRTASPPTTIVMDALDGYELWNTTSATIPANTLLPAVREPASGLLLPISTPIFGGVNVPFGSSYTFQQSDNGKLVVFAGTATATIPTGLSSTWFTDVTVIAPSTAVTITPASGLIDGVVSLTLRVGQGVRIFNGGTGWFTERGRTPGLTLFNHAGSTIDTDCLTLKPDVDGVVNIVNIATNTDQLIFSDASPTQRGVVSLGAQTFAGTKTFGTINAGLIQCSAYLGSTALTGTGPASLALIGGNVTIHSGDTGGTSDITLDIAGSFGSGVLNTGGIKIGRTAGQPSGIVVQDAAGAFHLGATPVTPVSGLTFVSGLYISGTVDPPAVIDGGVWT